MKKRKSKKVNHQTRKTEQSTQKQQPEPQPLTTPVKAAQVLQMQSVLGNAATHRLIQQGTVFNSDGGRFHSVQREAATGVPEPARFNSPSFASNADLFSVMNGSKLLKKGEQGEAVKLIQEALLKAGHALPKSVKDGKPDGHFGSETRSAVWKFQRDYGLSTDGVVGQNTMRQLDSVYAFGPNQTFYMGMNPGSDKEANVLEKSLGDRLSVSEDNLTTQAELSTDDGIKAYITDQMGIDPTTQKELFERVFTAVHQATPSFRDQMVGMLKVFQGAQQGNFQLERMVLSGHSVGSEMWGDLADEHEPGNFDIAKDLSNVQRAFPAAASQVQDVMLSACWTVTVVPILMQIFPNVRTIWAYKGSSPTIKSGSTAHISKWEQETRGDNNLDKRDKRGMSALWTKDEGFIVNSPGAEPIENYISIHYDYHEQPFQEEFEGDSKISDLQDTFYSNIQLILIHPDFGTLSSEQQKDIETKRDQILRLRYYDGVSKKFAEHYQQQIKSAYEAIGEPVPNFADMDRKELHEAIAHFQAKLGSIPKPDPAAQLFLEQQLNGLWSLSPEVVPNEWVGH